MSLAYLLSKASGNFFRVNIHVPLILVLSVLPDIDIIFNFIFNIEIHRGPTHSVITAILVFIPFFLLYRQKSIPYFIALVSHSLIADFFIGGQLLLLWPLSRSELGFTFIAIDSSVNIVLEFTLFVIGAFVMWKTRDLFQFFRNRKLNLILAIPIFTVLLPTFVGYPLTVPLMLVLPHLFYLVLFAISVLIVFKGLLMHS
jgi:hypothetical protein